MFRGTSGDQFRSSSPAAATRMGAAGLNSSSLSTSAIHPPSQPQQQQQSRTYYVNSSLHYHNSTSSTVDTRHSSPASSLIDIRKVADLVKQLAESRFELQKTRLMLAAKELEEEEVKKTKGALSSHSDLYNSKNKRRSTSRKYRNASHGTMNREEEDDDDAAAVSSASLLSNFESPISDTPSSSVLSSLSASYVANSEAEARRQRAGGRRRGEEKARDEGTSTCAGSMQPSKLKHRHQRTRDGVKASHARHPQREKTKNGKVEAAYGRRLFNEERDTDLSAGASETAHSSRHRFHSQGKSKRRDSGAVMKESLKTTTATTAAVLATAERKWRHKYERLRLRFTEERRDRTTDLMEIQLMVERLGMEQDRANLKRENARLRSQLALVTGDSYLYLQEGSTHKEEGRGGGEGHADHATTKVTSDPISVPSSSLLLNTIVTSAGPGTSSIQPKQQLAPRMAPLQPPLLPGGRHDASSTISDDVSLSMEAIAAELEAAQLHERRHQLLEQQQQQQHYREHSQSPERESAEAWKDRCLLLLASRLLGGSSRGEETGQRHSVSQYTASVGVEDVSGVWSHAAHTRENALEGRGESVVAAAVAAAGTVTADIERQGEYVSCSSIMHDCRTESSAPAVRPPHDVPMCSPPRPQHHQAEQQQHQQPQIPITYDVPTTLAPQHHYTTPEIRRLYGEDGGAYQEEARRRAEDRSRETDKRREMQQQQPPTSVPMPISSSGEATPGPLPPAMLLHCANSISGRQYTDPLQAPLFMHSTSPYASGSSHSQFPPASTIAMVPQAPYYHAQNLYLNSPPTRVDVAMQAGVAAPSSTRAQLEREIHRNDQLIAAVGKLQRAAAERTVRAPY